MDSVVLSFIFIIIICMILSFLFLGWKKGLIISSLLIVIFLAASTYLVIKDVKDIQDNIMTKEKLFVLMDGTKVISALTITSLDNLSTNPIKVMKDAELKSIESDLSIGYTNKLNEKYYKIVVFKKEMFNETLENGLNYEMEEQNIEITKQDFENFMSSSDPSAFLISKIMETNGYDQKNIPPEILEASKKEIYKKLNIDSPEQLKGYAFMILVADYAKEKGAIDFVYKFKDGKIEVHKKTAVFRFIDSVPNYFIDKIVQKVVADKEDA